LHKETQQTLDEGYNFNYNLSLQHKFVKMSKHNYTVFVEASL